MVKPHLAVSCRGGLAVGFGVAVVAAAACAALTSSAAPDPAAGAARAPVAAGTPAVQDSGTAPPSAPVTVPVTGSPGGSAPRRAAPKPVPVSELAADGIPATALTAYRRGAALAGARYPSCGIGWPLLAGIGRVESDHGRFAGAVLHVDGVSTPGIVGVPLSGHGTEVVRDTDHGVLDGDREFDRAVGPMQFIPSTWKSWQVDADRDGHGSPNDIDDAAAAAGAYLCAAGGDLRTYAGQRRAVLAYNHSLDYLRLVIGLERVYARGVMTVPAAPGHGHARIPKVVRTHPKRVPSPTAAPTRTRAPSPTPSPTRSHSPSPSPCATASSPSPSPSSRPSSNLSSSSSATPSPGPSSCAPPTPTPSRTPTPTSTPTPSP